MTPLQAVTPKRRLDAVVLAMVCIFVMFVAVNGAMLWVTLRAPPQLVSPSYWDDASRYGQVMDKERSSQETGWRVQIEEQTAAGKIAFKVLDSRGKPVTGLAGTVHAYRPSDSSLDRVLPVLENPLGSGTYAVGFAGAKSGHWDVMIDLKRASQRLYDTVPWTVP